MKVRNLTNMQLIAAILQQSGQKQMLVDRTSFEDSQSHLVYAEDDVATDGIRITLIEAAGRNLISVGKELWEERFNGLT